MPDQLLSQPSKRYRILSFKVEAIDRMTLSIVQNRTLLTGSPCQQCIIDREGIDQSEVIER